MGKVLALGIDSLDPRLLVHYQDDLPHFTELRARSPVVHATSVFPVDSIPAWVSIYTGLNPAQHGIIHTFDIFESSWQTIIGIDVGAFRGKTFWDRASASGKRVCIVNPFLAYPPWPVNGVMVSRSTDEEPYPGEQPWLIKKKIDAYPAESKQWYHIPDFVTGTKGRPPSKKDVDKYVEVLKKSTKLEGEIAVHLSEETDWDLFFAMFSWLDTVQHFFWRFCDEHDPTYPGPNAHEHVIRDFYQIYDEVLGRLVELHPETTTVVFSDHGHAMRPVKTVNVNESLRKAGLLAAKSSGTPLVPYLTENAKRFTLGLVRRFGLDSFLLNIAKVKRLSAISKDIYMSARTIDEGTSVAYLSSFAGPKSYSHGGIEINRENLDGRPYEEVRDVVTETLLSLEDPHTHNRLVKWACRREELYQGRHIALYPDIVFELVDGYGVYWGIFAPLIGQAYEHTLASGGHHKDAVFLVVNSDESIRYHTMSILDIGATILHLIGVADEVESEGVSILEG